MFPFAVRKQEALLTKENIVKLLIDYWAQISQVCHMSYCHQQQTVFDHPLFVDVGNTWGCK